MYERINTHPLRTHRHKPPLPADECVPSRANAVLAVNGTAERPPRQAAADPRAPTGRVERAARGVRTVLVGGRERSSERRGMSTTGEGERERVRGPRVFTQGGLYDNSTCSTAPGSMFLYESLFLHQ